MVNPDAVRGQVLLEESREAVVVLDEAGIVVAASRRARQALGVREGDEFSAELLQSERALVVPYTVDGRGERLVYLSEVGDLAAYEELRVGLHCRGVARAADTARPPALAARARCAPGRGRDEPRRAGAG